MYMYTCVHTAYAVLVEETIQQALKDTLWSRVTSSGCKQEMLNCWVNLPLERLNYKHDC